MVEFSKILKRVKKEGIADQPASPLSTGADKKPAIKPEPVKFEENKKRSEMFDREAAETRESDFQSDSQEETKEIKPLFANRRKAELNVVHDENKSFEAQYGQKERQVEKKVVNARRISEDSAIVYGKLFELAKSLFIQDVDYSKVDTKEIVSIVSEAAGAISAGDEKLVELALTYLIKEEEFYLHQHAVNCCIISLQIGVGAGLDMGHLIELGIAAFLHDIGMVHFEDVASLPRKLTPKEYEQIKSHVEVGSEILKKMDHGLSDTIIAAQNEIHERLDGSGYPGGKKAIHDYARIIAVADAFESMIHPRPFRSRYSIMDVYKRIFDQKDKYDQAFIKILLDRVGFFPNGSFVQLNTKETGKVVGQNPRSPLRPIVRIIYTEDGKELFEEDMKELNLVKYPTIHVKKCFLEESQQ